MYIVYFDDGSMQFFSTKPVPSHFQQGASFFEVPDTLTVADISEIIVNRAFDKPERMPDLFSNIRQI